MKILHAVHGFPPEFLGGTEQYVATLAQVQARADHTVAVLTGTSETAARARIQRAADTPPGVDVHRLVRYGLCGDRWYHTDAPHVERRLRAWFARIRPDVLHVHHFVRLTRKITRLAAAAGVPVVWTFHDLSATCPCFNRIDANGTFHATPLALDDVVALVDAPDWQHVTEVRGEASDYLADLAAEVAAASVFIAPSDAQRELITGLLALDPGRIRTVPHGTLSGAPPAASPEGSTTRPPEAGPARGTPAGGPLRLVHWGSLYPDKGVHQLLAAIDQLERRAAGRVHLTLWGEAVFPDYGERLRAAAAALPVRFAGPFTPDALHAADFDIAVFPTLAHESHSFVVDEAFQRGWPVIASALGALPGRIGGAGETVAPNDVAALAQVLERAAESADLRARWRRAIPGKLPSMTEHATTLDTIYERAIAVGPPPNGPPPPRITTARLLHERAMVNREHEIARLRAAL